MKTILYCKVKAVAALSAMLLCLPMMAGCNNKSQSAEAVAEESAEETSVLIDGAMGKLSAVVYRPQLADGAKCPMVILMHGFTANKDNEIVKAVAEKLQKEQIAYIRFDFNGHGESEGDFQNMTVLNEIEDARRVFEYARSLDYVDKIGLLGHSQGGVVTAMLAGELGADSVARVVLMAPAAVLRDDALSGKMFGVNYDPNDLPEYVEIHDGFRVGKDYIQVAQTLPIYETAAGYKGPACVIHGTGDVVVPYAYGERFLAGYNNAEWHPIDGDDHGFSQKMDEATDYAVAFLSKLKD